MNKTQLLPTRVQSLTNSKYRETSIDNTSIQLF